MIIKINGLGDVKLSIAARARCHVKFFDNALYYPPYHSKYNPVERCWGILEKRQSACLRRKAGLSYVSTCAWRASKAARAASATRWSSA